MFVPHASEFEQYRMVETAQNFELLKKKTKKQTKQNKTKQNKNKSKNKNKNKNKNKKTKNKKNGVFKTIFDKSLTPF